MTVPQVAVDAVTHYLQKGIGRGPAIGIVAVCYAGESKLNPGSQGTQSTETPGTLNPSGAYGIASWNGPRQAALQKFATAKGEPVGALNTQLDFILTECANSYSQVWAAIQANMAYTPFITLFVTVYEAPANPSAEISRSVAFAQQLDAAVPQTVPPVVPTPVPVPAPIPAPVTPTPGAAALNPFLLALIDAVVASLVREVISQTGVPLPTTTTTGATAPTTSTVVPLDPTTLVSSIITPLLSQLTGSLPALIAAELTKLIPTTTVKS